MNSITVDCIDQPLDYYEVVHDVERQIIKTALEESGWVVAHAAKRLNMNRTTLIDKIRRLEIRKEASNGDKQRQSGVG